MKLISNKNVILYNPDTKSFLADVYYPKTEEKLPLVIFVHGFKGYKDWGAWNVMCEQLAKAGNYVVKFNFSFNGTTLEKPDEFADLESFGLNNYSKEMSDLKFVINHFISNMEVDHTKVTIIGHSRGGGIAVLSAFWDSRITKVITMAGVSDYKSLFVKGDTLEKWKKEGVLYSENKRTHQKMPLYYQFYEDYELNENYLNIEHAAKHLNKPYLIFHGTKDEAVDIKDAQNLHEWCKTSELIILNEANHTFGIKEPWTENTLSHDLQIVTDKTIDFLKN